MTKIKLCGMMSLNDIETANACRPDYIGFIFAKKSRRYVSPELAGQMKELLSKDIKAVGVFVNAPAEETARLYEAGIIDVIQLHGSEDEAYIRELRSLCDAPLIKAFRIDQEEDVATAMACSADLVLLDSGNGGTGTSFDWELIGKAKRPYILAGGLSPDNVKAAVDSLKPYGVDVSSGIETDGKKDPLKMRNFVNIVRME